ncbi:anaphase-promoting complex subunit 10 isoform X1 [Apium graveolens]|uniref:anaphase-promoting complex subunit 10 isoform X1 n=1 Tax=Apium graveolens TaxID=4045 RepID=UPI003D7B765D
MATESSEADEESKLVGGNQQLVVDDSLREMAKQAAWSVSSCKPGNGVLSLRDDNLDSFWQSDGAQPHLVNIQFQKKVKLQLVVLYVDYKLDESYTPSKIAIRAGDGFHNLKEIKTVELVKPTGWVYISLSGNDPREAFVNTFMLQIAVLSNHLNGRDTHVRQIKVYGPRPLCYVSGILFHINHFNSRPGSSSHTQLYAKEILELCKETSYTRTCFECIKLDTHVC